MEKFADIEAKAYQRHGGEAGVKEKIEEFSSMNNKVPVTETPDDRFLSQMTKCVFQAGFNWSVIENKWDGFEAAFQGFDIDACAFLSDDAIDELAKDTRIVRNRPKIITVPGNARFIQKVRDEKGSFGKFLSTWPADDQIGLMEHLQANGSRLGGKTGMYFLRFSGWDAFIFSKDGTAALVEAGVAEKYPLSGKGAFKKAQEAMNAWHEESGRPYAEISRILALSTDLTKQD